MQARTLLILAFALTPACKDAPISKQPSKQRTPTAQPQPAPVIAAPVASPSPVVGINGIEAGNNCDTPASACSGSAKLRSSLENALAKWTHLGVTNKRTPKELLDSVDCLALRGGADIDPARFEEPPHPSISPLSSAREDFDFALINEALRRKMPILGICLGAQEISVALGGDMVQDIPSEIDNALNHREDHNIEIRTGTLVAEIYGEKVMVHSNHHQSLDRLGKGLRVSATASDGVIEAFEAADRTNYPFLVGVQYHPEFEVGTEHDKLFEAFAAACQDYAAARRIP